MNKSELGVYEVVIKRMPSWKIAIITGSLFIILGLFLVLLSGPLSLLVEKSIGFLLLLGSIIMIVSSVALFRNRQITGKKNFGIPIIIIAILLFIISFIIFTSDFFGKIFIIILSLSFFLEGLFNFIMGLQIQKNIKSSWWYISIGVLTMFASIAILFWAFYLLDLADSVEVITEKGKELVQIKRSFTAGKLITIYIGVKTILTGVTTFLLGWAAKEKIR